MLSEVANRANKGEKTSLPYATFDCNSTNFGECGGLILINHGQISSVSHWHS